MKLRQINWSRLVSGRMKATIRLGRRDPELGPLRFEQTEDETVTFDCVICSITHKRYRDVDVDDAYACGYESEGELRAVLPSIYPSIKDEDEVTMIHFRSEAVDDPSESDCR